MIGIRPPSAAPLVRPVATVADRRWRAERTMAIGLAITLVLLRGLVYLLFEQARFNSDHAIVGLMAKHLIEGRAFPLFFYGQAYMLAVEAWTAVPAFLIAGPTVAALRGTVLAWNVAFAVLLIIGLERGAGLRPWHGLVASLFFLAAPPSVAALLSEAMGGMIEPFVFVAVLWLLRDRPFWFGAVLGIGFLNREFTLYAVPVLLVIEAFTGRLMVARLRGWGVSLVVFLAVWETVDALKPFADLAGPGTRGELLGGFADSQVSNLLARFNPDLNGLLLDAASTGRQVLAWVLGAVQVDTMLPVPERPWIVWPLYGVAVLVVARVVFLFAGPRGAGAIPGGPATSSLRDRATRTGFAVYLLGVGLVAAAVFVAGRGSGVVGYVRYLTLCVLIPVGTLAALFALEHRAPLRRLAMAGVIGWASLAVTDHVRLLASYVRTPPPNLERQLADRLVAEGVVLAQAGYWHAYTITFLSGERVKVASTDVVRISEYQRLAARDRRHLVSISESPCPGAEEVAGFYLCRPDPGDR